MRASILVAILGSLAVVGGVATLAISRGAGGFTRGSVDSRESARLEARIATLESATRKCQDRIAELEALQLSDEVKAPDAEAPEEKAAAVAEAAPATAGEASESSVAKTSAPATRLERWLDAHGMRQDMDALMARAYESGRNVRREKERLEAEAREKEVNELSQGPYGRHNYRVNSLAKKLELDERQQSYLFGLLSSRDTTMQEAKSELSQLQKSGAAQEQIEENMRRISIAGEQSKQQLESDFVKGLTREQQEAYKALPEEDRLSNGDRFGMRVLGLGDGVKIFANGQLDVAGERLIEKVIVPAIAPAPPPTGK